MQAQIEKWLQGDEVDVFLGYKVVDGHLLPHCFTRENLIELKDLAVGQAHYALEKFATHLATRHPDLKIGILLRRECNQRALYVLSVWNQLKLDQIQTIEAFEDPSVTAQSASGGVDEPAPPGDYKQQRGLDKAMTPAAVEKFDPQERFSRWMYEFQKCIKCYGCRDICPVCFCRECSLQHSALIRPGNLPPEIPIFHLVRAVHMAGRCIDCGLCEEACPMDIPLRLLYRRVDQIVKDVFEYETGTNPEQSPFSVLGDTVVLETRPISDPE